MPDADLDQAANALVARLKALLWAFEDRAFDRLGTEMGPLATVAHRNKISPYIDVGGSRSDGRGYKLQGHEKGLWQGGTDL